MNHLSIDIEKLPMETNVLMGPGSNRTISIVRELPWTVRAIAVPGRFELETALAGQCNLLHEVLKYERAAESVYVIEHPVTVPRGGAFIIVLRNVADDMLRPAGSIFAVETTPEDAYESILRRLETMERRLDGRLRALERETGKPGEPGFGPRW